MGEGLRHAAFTRLTDVRTVLSVFLMHWGINLARHMASLTASPP